MFTTTHVTDEAELTDKVALLLHGDIIAFDTPQGPKECCGVSTVEETLLAAKDREEF